MTTDGDEPSPLQISVIGLALALFFLVFLYLLIALWPSKAAATTVQAVPGQNAGDWSPFAVIFGKVVQIPSDVRFLLIVALSAALGSFIAIATSFTTYVGNRKFLRSWIWWYILRIPIGVALALLFYFAVRGGFFTSVSSTDLNPFGIAALGGLVGMFSKQASDKLQDIFQELFKSSQDQARGDKLTAPVITSTNPATVTTSTGQILLIGSGFVQAATASVNGAMRKTTFVDPHTLTLAFDPSDLQAGKSLNIVVTTPGPAGASSAPYPVTVS